MNSQRQAHDRLVTLNLQYLLSFVYLSTGCVPIHTKEAKDICIMVGSFCIIPGQHIVVGSRLKDHLRLVLSLHKIM